MLAWWGMAVAFADTPVVVARGAEVTAVDAVARDTGTPLWNLDPLVYGAGLTGTKPVVLGRDQPASCTGSTATTAEIRDAVSLAEGQVLYEKLAEARVALDGAAARLPCLTKPAEASLGGRLFLLQGYVAAQEGDKNAASAAFTRMASFQPDIAWDKAFPPDHKPLFDAALAAQASGPKGRIVLAPGVGTLGVDGSPVVATNGIVEVPVGRHLVQVLPEASSVEVDVRPDEVVAIVVPDRIGEGADTIVQAPAEPANQLLIEAWFASRGATLGYVWTGQETWAVPDWKPLPSIARDPAEARREKARVVRLASAGLLLTGAVAMGAGMPMYFANASADGAPEDAQTALSRRYRAGTGTGLFDAGAVAAGLGAVGLGVSFAL